MIVNEIPFHFFMPLFSCVFAGSLDEVLCWMQQADFFIDEDSREACHGSSIIISP
jgi:hypothetical protein